MVPPGFSAESRRKAPSTAPGCMEVCYRQRRGLIWAQPKTPRNTVPTSNVDLRSGGATAVATRPAAAKSASSTRGPQPTHEQISKRAHEIWIKRGCKPGQDEQNWLEAEAQLRAEMAGR